jgi:hypothetical protein
MDACPETVEHCFYPALYLPPEAFPWFIAIGLAFGAILVAGRALLRGKSRKR